MVAEPAATGFAAGAGAAALGAGAAAGEGAGPEDSGRYPARLLRF